MWQDLRRGFRVPKEETLLELSCLRSRFITLTVAGFVKRFILVLFRFFSLPYDTAHLSDVKNVSFARRTISVMLEEFGAEKREIKVRIN